MNASAATMVITDLSVDASTTRGGVGGAGGMGGNGGPGGSGGSGGGATNGGSGGAPGGRGGGSAQGGSGASGAASGVGGAGSAGGVGGAAQGAAISSSGALTVARLLLRSDSAIGGSGGVAGPGGFGVGAPGGRGGPGASGSSGGNAGSGGEGGNGSDGKAGAPAGLAGVGGGAGASGAGGVAQGGALHSIGTLDIRDIGFSGDSVTGGSGGDAAAGGGGGNGTSGGAGGNGGASGGSDTVPGGAGMGAGGGPGGNGATGGAGGKAGSGGAAVGGALFMSVESTAYARISYTGGAATGGAGGRVICTVFSPAFVLGEGCPGIGGVAGIGGTGGTGGLNLASVPPVPGIKQLDGANGVVGDLGSMGTAGSAGSGTSITCNICAALVDTVAPRVAMTSPRTAFVSSSAITVSWTASDTGSGLLSSELRWQRGLATVGALSAVVYPPTWKTLAATSLTYSGSPGYRYCFAVRARDKVGNVSAWSSVACTTIPIDDRALTASKGWNRATGSGWIARTYTSTTRNRATQTLGKAVRARQLGVVAATCPSCGKVAFYVGTKLVGRLSLVSPTSRIRLLLLPRFATARVGVIKIRVTSRSGKLVRLDAIAVTST